MTRESLRMAFTGDIILDEPNPQDYFTLLDGALADADLVVGHVEVPYARPERAQVQDVRVPAPPANPENLSALADAGFDVVTLAANLVFDCGPNGVADTISTLRQHGILTVGAGANIREARQPAYVRRHGRSFGFLAYNCVGPTQSWASEEKAGCAYVFVPSEGENPLEVEGLTFGDCVKLMQDDVRAARRHVDVLSVSLHKGQVHRPVVVAEYERLLSRAAIDAGADIVIGHHAHILRGVEIYKNRPIFHGLGNFVTVTRALAPTGGDGALATYARERMKRFGFELDSAMPTYPFHPQSRNTMIACIEVRGGRIIPAVRPLWIDGHGRPVAVARNEGAEEVAHYIAGITDRAGLGATYEWSGDQRTLLVRAAAAKEN